MVVWMAGAFAAPTPPAAEEVLVYGDPFARWDHTRWLVQNEQWIPIGATFAADRNRAFGSHALQLRAVVGCDKDAALSRAKWEVSCAIEDVALTVTTDRDWGSEAARARVQGVLDEIDAKLTGMAVQMQVDDSGRVMDFDLEGIEADNSRERAALETLREVVTGTMAGFHLEIPDHTVQGGKWVEYNSDLMTMAGLLPTRGSSTFVHQVSPYGDANLVQSVGQGVLRMTVPASASSMFHKSALSGDYLLKPVEPTLPVIKTGGLQPVTPIVFPAPPTTDDQISPDTRSGSGNSLEFEYSYALQASGAAVFRRSDGIMSERVWVVEGVPTGSSGGGAYSCPMRNVGRIQQLASDEAPDLGPSRQVSWPGHPMDGLDPWTALEAFPPSP